MFLQAHYLTSYAASLLNRDDAGLAKRIMFGGVPRLRVSSQCQKRHWREAISGKTDLPVGMRSRHFFDRIIKVELVDDGMDEAQATELILHLANEVFTTAGDKDALDTDTLQMKQPILFGRPEADYFLSILREAASQGDQDAAKAFLDGKMKKGKGNFNAMVRAAGFGNSIAGFEGALFGRFVTSDILARTDASVHVAHAFTTHALDTEVDFFTVVDDLAEEAETGGAHMNDMELGAGIFYGYVAVDVPLLISNLTGCERANWRRQDNVDARQLLEVLIHSIAEVTPGAKLGSTAPYSLAECVVLEIGGAQPRTLANAFIKPIRMSADSHPMAESVNAMAAQVDSLETMYGNTGERRYVSTIHNWSRDSDGKASLPDSIEQSLNDIFGTKE